MTLPIVLYGSHTCEDTAVSRDRLKMLQIHFDERDKEDDEQIGAVLEKYNQGHQRTPTLIFGDKVIVIAEPTLEQLEECLRQAGYVFSPPGLRAFNAKRYLPDFSNLPAIRPASDSAPNAKALFFFAHGPACRTCQGFAKQLNAQSAQFDQAGVRWHLILRADLKQAKEWAKEFAANVAVLADADGNFKRTAADNFPDTWDIRSGGTWLWYVDAADVIRAGEYAPDAGGLPAPQAVLNFIAEQK